ncbi:MAG: hypothetical protein Q4C34_04755 [Bacteroidales bacterium]|nr:hypothetical protein [Bacteroidales bacterium]
MKTVILTIVLIALCIVLLGVKVFFVKGGRFPSGHVGHSPEMRRRGIGCAAHTNRK